MSSSSSSIGFSYISSSEEYSAFFIALSLAFYPERLTTSTAYLFF